MIPSFLITFREVIEASLIVAAILGILSKLGDKKGMRTVWWASGSAALVSSFLLIIGSLFGLRIQQIYRGRTEEIIEGILMIISAVFITWAVFFLHNYFGKYKTKLLQKIKKNVQQEEQKGLFLLAFTAVVREGFEIVLFLSTVFFSASPQKILAGFSAGALSALLVSWGLFTATLRLPIFYAFRITSTLLILFAAGLLARGVHEFTEAGFIPVFGRLTFHILPEQTNFISEMIKAVFGITRQMDYGQLTLYLGYSLVMVWWVFFRKKTSAN